jgi:hypothetical protein
MNHWPLPVFITTKCKYGSTNCFIIWAVWWRMIVQCSLYGLFCVLYNDISVYFMWTFLCSLYDFSVYNVIYLDFLCTFLQTTQKSPYKLHRKVHINYTEKSILTTQKSPYKQHRKVHINNTEKSILTLIWTFLCSLYRLFCVVNMDFSV